uniref:Uncharacterized protein n=1 Tax=Candidatus Kentrum sp. TUN TaxID=2126343 RepID=A0A450ZXN5_9GAMM|nr:MAG: hypothetical protein BECKTUN1418D_GA0071000_108412 [Candidatus Kentron sp. TUN]
MGAIGGLTIISSIIGLIKWIRGRPIINNEKNDDGKITITTGDGDNVTVNERLWEMYKNKIIIRNLKTAIHDPLSRDGVESVGITSKNEGGSIVNWDEEGLFDTLHNDGKLIGEDLSEKSLEIISPSFQSGNKWRFLEGFSPFHASISDSKFIERVNNSETFSKGDVLKVELRSTRYEKDGRIVTDLDITKVIDHIKTPNQQDINLDADE